MNFTNGNANAMLAVITYPFHQHTACNGFRLTGSVK